MDMAPSHRCCLPYRFFGPFVAAVYIYDQLSTPPGFWTDGNKSRYFWRKLYDIQERYLEKRWDRAYKKAEGKTNPGAWADDDQTIARLTHDGPMYWLMVRTSRLVFTPAVILSLLGFLTLLSGTEDTRILVGGAGALIIAGVYSAFYRPNLGAD